MICPWWVKLILEALASLFKWRAQVTDPQASRHKEEQDNYERWEKTLKELENAETKTRRRWLAKCGLLDRNSLGADGADLDKFSLTQLQTARELAGRALGDWRQKRPHRQTDRPESC